MQKMRACVYFYWNQRLLLTRLVIFSNLFFIFLFSKSILFFYDFPQSYRGEVHTSSSQWHLFAFWIYGQIQQVRYLHRLYDLGGYGWVRSPVESSAVVVHDLGLQCYRTYPASCYISRLMTLGHESHPSHESILWIGEVLFLWRLSAAFLLDHYQAA